MSDSVLLCLGLILFSIFGACVKWMNARDCTTRTLAVLITEIITAIFIGGLVYSLYCWLDCHKGMAFSLAGVAGYCGINGVDVLVIYIFKRLHPNKSVDELAEEMRSYSDLRSKIITKNKPED